jgi:hypothetical protein
MEMKADTSQILMSDVLKGNVPELENEAVEASGGKAVLVVFEKVVGDKSEGLVGILRGVLFDANPEVEVSLQVEEALGVVKASNLYFRKFELHYGNDVVAVPGPFIVAAARIDTIDVFSQTCTLSLHLKRPAR